MKKTISCLLLVLLFFFSFSLVKISAKNDSIRIWVGAIEKEKEAMQAIGNQFKNETGISVEVIQKLEIFTVPTALVNNAKLSSAPDIVYLQAPDIGGLVKSDLLEPITISDELKNSFVDVAFEAFTLDGEVYGIGYNNSTSGLLYNKDIITEEELPETWDEFFSLAKDKTIFNDKNEIVRRGAYFNLTDMWFNYPIIRHYGGYYYGKHLRVEFNCFDIGLDNEGMLAYVTKMKEIDDFGLAIRNKEIKDYSPIITSFADQKTAMFLYGLWSAQILKNRGVNYGLAPLPYSGDERSKPLSTVEGYVINKYSNNLENAKLFYQYLYRDENQQKLIEAGNKHDLKTGERNPCNISVIESSYIQSDEILTAISEIGKHVEPFPNIPEGPLWYNQNVTSTTLANVFFGDDRGNEVDAKQKLTELANYLRNEVKKMNDDSQTAVKKAPYIIGGIVLGIIIIGGIVFLEIRRRKVKKYQEINNTRETVIGYLLLVPFIAIVTIFYLYPIFHNIHLSLTNYSGTNLVNYCFIGLSNYKTIFTTELNGLLKMTIWTICFAFFVTTISFVFGTLLATVIDKTNEKIAKIYRVIYILPWVIPTVITLLMWQGLLATENGLINQLLGFIGIKNIPWLTKPRMARFSTIMVMIGFSFPYYMVIAFGFLKSLNKDYYEAAHIDGASSVQIFTKITLPLIFRALTPMLIMGFIMQFNQFGVYLLTQGGPASEVIGAPGATDLLVTYVFNTSFNTKRYALAASYSVIIFIFMGLFALITMSISQRKERG